MKEFTEKAYEYFGTLGLSDQETMASLIGRYPSGEVVEAKGFEAVEFSRHILPKDLKTQILPKYKLIGIREALNPNLQPDENKIVQGVAWRITKSELRLISEWQLSGLSENALGVLQNIASIKVRDELGKERWILGEVINVRGQGEKILDGSNYLQQYDWLALRRMAANFRKLFIAGNPPAENKEGMMPLSADDVNVLVKNGLVDAVDQVYKFQPKDVTLLEYANMKMEVRKNRIDQLKSAMQAYEVLLAKSDNNRWQEYLALQILEESQDKKSELDQLQQEYDDLANKLKNFRNGDPLSIILDIKGPRKA